MKYASVLCQSESLNLILSAEKKSPRGSTMQGRTFVSNSLSIQLTKCN